MGRNANAHSKRSNPALWFMGISTARPQFRASPDCEYLLLVGTRTLTMIRPHLEWRIDPMDGAGAVSC